LYNRVTFGTLKTTYIKEFTDLTRREAAVFVTLLLFMLILGISANFVLDFVHVALKGIIINAEVGSLKTSFSYEALPLSPVVAFATDPRTQVTSMQPTNLTLECSRQKHPFHILDSSLFPFLVSLYLFTLLVLLNFYGSSNTFLSVELTSGSTCTIADPLAAEVLPPSLAGFLFVRFVSRRLPPMEQEAKQEAPQATQYDEWFYALGVCAYLVVYIIFVLFVTTDLFSTQEEVSTLASAALVCSLLRKSYLPVFLCSTRVSNLSTLSGRDSPAASPASSGETSVTTTGNASQSSLHIAPPPFSAYKRLLMLRFKHPLLYDSEAKGILGWFRNLRRPRPTAPYQ